MALSPLSARSDSTFSDEAPPLVDAEKLGASDSFDLVESLIFKYLSQRYWTSYSQSPEFARVILGVGGAPSDARGPASDPNASNASPEKTEPSDEKRASSSSEEEPPPYTAPSSDGSSTRSARGGSAVRSIHARCSSPNHA